MLLRFCGRALQTSPQLRSQPLPLHCPTAPLIHHDSQDLHECVIKAVLHVKRKLRNPPPPHTHTTDPWQLEPAAHPPRYSPTPLCSPPPKTLGLQPSAQTSPQPQTPPPPTHTPLPRQPHPCHSQVLHECVKAVLHVTSKPLTTLNSSSSSSSSNSSNITSAVLPGWRQVDTGRHHPWCASILVISVVHLSGAASILVRHRNPSPKPTAWLPKQDSMAGRLRRVGHPP